MNILRIDILAVSITLAAMVVLALQVDAQEQSYDLRIEGVTGRVKSIEEFEATITLSNGVAKESSRSLSRVVRFDKTGRKTYEWSQISGMDAIERFYSYDENKRSTRTLRAGPRSVETHSYSIFSFDIANNTLNEKVFPGREEERRKQTQGYTFRFDTNGCLAEEIMLTADNKPLLKKVYIYENDCLPSELRIGHASGVGRIQVLKYAYEMDDNGNWKKQTIENTLANTEATKKREVIYRKLKYYR